TIAASLLFLIAAWQLNRLTLALSPVALGSVFLYSYTKRFTSLSHLVLGWSLSIAPSGAWIAIKGELNLLPVLLSLAVMLWNAAFYTTNAFVSVILFVTIASDVLWLK